MFLHYIKDNSMICDFQLIYDTDCKLQFDFYAYGLVKEPEIFGVDVRCNIISYGMVKVSKEGYKIINKEMQNIIDDSIKLKILLLDTRQAIQNLKEENLNLEMQMKNNKYDIIQLKNTFNALSIVMSYRRISDFVADKLAEQINLERYSKLDIPSYLIILDENRKKIKSVTDAKIFIEEYGYLSTFDIGAYDYENINLYVFNNSIEAVLRPLNVPYNDSKCENVDEELLYGFTWFSELRHIFQARTLRNFRRFLLSIGKDIYETGVKELFDV